MQLNHVYFIFDKFSCLCGNINAHTWRGSTRDVSTHKTIHSLQFLWNWNWKSNLSLTRTLEWLCARKTCTLGYHRVEHCLQMVQILVSQHFLNKFNENLKLGYINIWCCWFSTSWSALELKEFKNCIGDDWWL